MTRVRWLRGCSRLFEIAGLIDAGDLRPVVTRVVDLDEVAQADRLIDSGRTRGKVVLRVP